jgi:hypothetical protein
VPNQGPIFVRRKHLKSIRRLFYRLDEAKDLPNLVTAPRSTFAPLEDLQAPPQAAPPLEGPRPSPAETPQQAPPSERSDDVSRLRAAAAEAAERRAAEARAAQGQALPPGEDGGS